ncbi:MAG TPA: UxaA family hydrolase [Thermoguttaceae bacterium]|nr:UxaA family hydrolase [Thermoguttaceae bacterium]
MTLGIQIHSDDNVVTVLEDTAPGDEVQYVTEAGPASVTTTTAVPSGHKVALCDIEAEEPVVKYNQPIGLASIAIRRGEHVHAHNVRSAVQGAGNEN